MEALNPPLDVAPARAQAPTLSAPSGQELLVAAGGFVLLGLSASLGSGSLETVSHNLPGTLATSVGALVLTGPALLVAHQFLRLDASPQALAAALGRGFALSGRLALGLSAPMIFFTATSSIWTALLTASLVLIALMGLSATASFLVRAEREATESPVNPSHMFLLALAWCALTALSALRIAVDVLLYA